MKVRLLLLVPLVVVLLGVGFLASAGLSAAGGPPKTDGSTYSWPGAKMLTVNVDAWGGGYVLSEGDYRINCPFACIRPYDVGEKVTLHAYPTPGFSFVRWEGAACADQGNPCTFTIATDTPVTAIFVAPTQVETFKSDYNGHTTTTTTTIDELGS